MNIRLIVTILMLFLGQISIAQIYKVVQINGKILNNGAAIKLGDELDESHASGLVFEHENAVASLFHPDKGKYKLSKTGLESIASNPTASASRPALCQSIRSFGFNNDDEPYNYLVLGTLEQNVSKLDLPLKNKKSQYFAVRYQYEGQTVEHKLESFVNSDLNQVLINKATVFGDRNPDLATDVTIVYYDNKTQKECRFNPVFPNEDEVKLEIEMLVKANEEDTAVMLEKVLQHLRNFYGAPNLENVKIWLVENFDIEL